MNIIVDDILKTLFKWETRREDYPFCIAVHPRILHILFAEVPFMMALDYEKQQYKFRGFPVVVVHDSNDDYFEFMDEETAKKRAGRMVVHLCMKAPTDFLAWRTMGIGEKCHYCGEVITEDTRSDA